MTVVKVVDALEFQPRGAIPVYAPAEPDAVAMVSVRVSASVSVIVSVKEAVE